MNKEQEQLLNKYKAEGKLTQEFQFLVKHKLTGAVNPVPGVVICGFLDPNIYEISEMPEPEPKAEEPEAKPVEVKPDKKGKPQDD